MSWSTVREAIDAIGQGDFVLVVDDEARENEGDLIMAAEKVTEEQIAFMVRHTSGLICVPVTGERLDELGLPLMVMDNTDTLKTAFTVSVDYVHGTTTGISAADRSATIRALADAATSPSDLTRPGHVFPLRYRSGGVLARPGHTEAAVDLARLAGLSPAGVLCEVVNDDGSMARGPELLAFAEAHGIRMITIESLVAHRWQHEVIVTREVETTLPTDHGTFAITGYRSALDGTEHLALVMGEVAGKPSVLTRVHSECLTGDALGSLRCDCREQLQRSLRAVAEEGEGIVIYNRGHEGRGIGLLGKLAAYRLQDDGLDTVEANETLGYAPDARHYGPAAQILADLKVSSVRLLTNNPAKVTGLTSLGIDVVGRIPLWVGATDRNASYLAAKASKLGHIPPEAI